MESKKVKEGGRIMPRFKKRKAVSVECKVSGHLRANEFKVEIDRDGWENVASFLKNVSFADFPDGNELRLDFVESRELDVLVFFTDWVVNKASCDVVVKLGSGKRGLLFSGCYVDSMIIDELDSSDGEKDINVSVILKYVAVFIIDKERSKVVG
jgi:hypothetical protein